MGYVIALIVVVVAGLALLMLRRRSTHPPVEAASEPPEPSTPPSHRPDPAPMTGLESALDQATDRSGRPMRERIDEEAGHIDELRVQDDTGPLLRRALDHVAHRDETDAPPDAPPDPPSDHTGDAAR